MIDISSYPKVLYKHDVWQIRVDKYDTTYEDRYLCQFGYVTPSGIFHIVCGYNSRNKDTIINAATEYAKVLYRFETQQEMSAELLKFLQNPQSASTIFELGYVWWNAANGELTYRDVPVPIYRNDFPDRMTIILALDTQLQLLNPSPVLKEAWKDWLEVFKIRARAKERSQTNVWYCIMSKYEVCRVIS